MSDPKITAKNLSYDTSLPPFLQRLHNSSTSNSASRDGRHERAIARPRRPRDADADKEDEPVFVDEETGEVVNAEELKALAAGATAESKQVGSEGDRRVPDRQIGKEDGIKGEERGKEPPAATIGASRKRKAVKVVGGDEPAAQGAIEDGDQTDPKKKKEEEEEEEEVVTGRVAQEKIGSKGNVKGKSKMRVKLSFGDDEEG